MSKERKHLLLDMIAETMDLLYQAWRILYDEGRDSDDEVTRRVEKCLIILGKVRKAMVPGN